MEDYLFRDNSPYPIDVASTNGNYMMDKNGKKYLDFTMGWCVGNAGWNKKKIIEKIRSFKGPTYVNPNYSYERWNDLSRKIVSLMPNKDYTCFRATGGTEAVEIALKTARAYNHRKKFIAFKEAYHGQSFACMGLVGIPEHEKNFGPFPDSYVRLDASDWDTTAERAVKEIRKKEICAFISEPIICNLGVIVPPKAFFRDIREACRETGTVFIMDEVATGFGRTGKMFGFEHYDLDPDIITIAKGFSSGYGAIGSAVAKSDIANSMRFDFSNFSTFGWHPLSVESALANIDYIVRNKLSKKAEESGKYIMDLLSGFCRAEGMGLCIGFDIRNANLENECLRDGLIMSVLNDRGLLFPALDVSRKEIDKAIGIIKKHF